MLACCCRCGLLDAGGQIIGTRGIGQDVSAQDGYDSAMATSLRRGEVLDVMQRRLADPAQRHDEGVRPCRR